MARSLKNLETCFSRLDSKIKPVAKRPVNLSNQDAFADLAAGPHPLDETETREEAEQLLLELVNDYMEATPDWRAGVRGLFRRFDSFAWAAVLRLDRRTEDGILAHLVMFSLKDQGSDPRDAKLWLSDLCDEARHNGLDVGITLRKVAALSSDEDRYGWGSTRRWLEDAA